MLFEGENVWVTDFFVTEFVVTLDHRDCWTNCPGRVYRIQPPILVVPSSNLGPKTSYHDRMLVELCVKLGQRRFLSYPLRSLDVVS